MCQLKPKKVEVSLNRFLGAIVAIICLIMAGSLIWGLQDCLRRGVIAGAIILSLLLLVFIGTFVLSLAAIIGDRDLGEVIDEDLVSWWRKKGINVARGVARRLLYLLGAAACGGAVYLSWLVEKWTREALTASLVAKLLGSLATLLACFVTLIGFVLVVLAITGRPLSELATRKR